MPDKKSSSEYLKWLAYGKANGLLPNDNDQLALGGDIKGLKKNTPIPYDYLNNLSQINYYADGGELDSMGNPVNKDPLSGLGGGAIPYAQLGNIAGNVIEGDNNLYSNRNASLEKATAGEALKGAGTGAMIGANPILAGATGGLSIAAGALIGGVAGGITGNKNFKEHQKDFADTLDQNKVTPNTVQYYGAYGMELPEIGMGGEPTEFNGNTHENGGLALGDNVEVEDGEIRVGNYVFSNRLVNPETGRTYATEAKKVTAKYKEYENDGPSMRTQNKMLEELKAKNDIAREQQKAIDAQKQEAMQTDFAAYGAMIQKDSKGSYIVDNSNKRLLMDNAKGHKMSYNTYLDSLYACGGNVKNKLAYGGPPQYGINPEDNLVDPVNNYGTPYTPSPLQPDSPFKGTSFPTDYKPEVKNDLYVKDPNAPLDFVDEKGNPVYYKEPGYNHTALEDGVPSANTDNSIGSALENTTDTSINNTSDGKNLDYKRADAALFASTLPAIDNLLQSSRKTNTKFNRVDLQDINMDQERSDIKGAISRARSIQNQNVRNTATSSGDALAALSSGNAGLTGQEINALSGVNANERNANTQIRNQESMTNTDIANQEMIARQQDSDLRASIRNMALGNIGTNVQGNMRDKTAIDKNAAYNEQVKALMDSGEYRMLPDDKGILRPVYVGNQNLPELQVDRITPKKAGNIPTGKQYEPQPYKK